MVVDRTGTNVQLIRQSMRAMASGGDHAAKEGANGAICQGAPITAT
jgi:hypothetical protein